MRYDGSSVMAALMSNLHGIAVAKDSANKRHEHNQSPTSIAPSRRTIPVAITAINDIHPVTIPSKKLAAGSVLATCIGQVKLTSAHSKDLSCSQLPRGARQKLCMCMLRRGCRGQVPLIYWAAGA